MSMKLPNNLDMAMMQFSICLKPPCLQNYMALCMGHDNLYIVMTMLKDIYAKKPQPAAAAATVGTAQGATTPFTLIHSPTRNAPETPNETPLEERIAQLTETLY